MTLAITTKAVNNPLTDAAEIQSSVTSTSPYFYQIYNSATKALFGRVIYVSKGTTSTVGGIVACDTYANLQSAVTAAGLVGTLSAAPAVS